jgi:hypothetical protein
MKNTLFLVFAIFFSNSWIHASERKIGTLKIAGKVIPVFYNGSDELLKNSSFDDYVMNEVKLRTLFLHPDVKKVLVKFYRSLKEGRSLEPSNYSFLEIYYSK